MRPLALVTGSHRRLGAHLAARLGEAGWDVALHASGADSVPEPWLCERLEQAGARWHSLAADLAEGDAAERLVAEAAAAFGRRVTMLVNNASCFRAGDGTVPEMAAMLAHYAVNTAAPVVLAHALAAQGGEAVVNILDQRIALPHADQQAYTLSKQALAGATVTLAAALSPGVRVNAVAPGLILPTPDYAAGQLDRLAAAMPLGRLPDPDAVADAVLFLAGAWASTGQLLFVDGGASMTRFERDFVHLCRD